MIATALFFIVSVLAGITTVYAEDGIFQLNDNLGSREQNLLPPEDIQRRSKIDLAVSSIVEKGRPAERVVLNLFPDVTLNSVMERFEPRAGGGYYWWGKVEDDPYSMVAFTVLDEKIVGTVEYSGRRFLLSWLPDDTYGIAEINPTALRPDDEARPDPDSDRGDNDRGDYPIPFGGKGNRQDPFGGDIPLDDGSVIDVMVLLTKDTNPGPANYGKYLYWFSEIFGFNPGVGWILNNLGSLQTFSEQLVVPHLLGVSNQVLVNSGVNTKFNLIHVETIDFNESGSVAIDSDSLEDPYDGNGDAVHKLRNKFAADIVVLITHLVDPDKCGKAAAIPSYVSFDWEDTAFAVVNADCLLKQFTFVHEIGHLMGARHDWFVDQTNGQPFGYNHGFTFDPSGFVAMRTVMAYRDLCDSLGNSFCPRVPFFSDGGPQLGKPIGSNKAADNTVALNQTRWTIANYRPSWCRTHDCSSWF